MCVRCVWDVCGMCVGCVWDVGGWTATAGPHFAAMVMDSSAHESTENLVDYAHDTDQSSIWTNAMLDPEH